jgi:hypothetical protein
VVSGIRNKQFTIPSEDESKPATVIETMRQDRVSTEKRLTEDQFYKHLREKYLITEDQMRSNSYPVIEKNEEGKYQVNIVSDEGRKNLTDDDGKTTFTSPNCSNFRFPPNMLPLRGRVQTEAKWRACGCC